MVSSQLLVRSTILFRGLGALWQSMRAFRLSRLEKAVRFGQANLRSLYHIRSDVRQMPFELIRVSIRRGLSHLLARLKRGLGTLRWRLKAAEGLASQNALAHCV